MNKTLAGILSTKSTHFDAVKDARELRAALDNLTLKTPSLMAEAVSPDDVVRKMDNPEPLPATDPSIAEFRKLNRAGESR